jgi:DNA modification methylase
MFSKLVEEFEYKKNQKKRKIKTEESEKKTNPKNTKITLWNGDCIEEMKRIPSKSIDMVCCDPPYGTTQCKWDSSIDLNKMWIELKRITKENGAIVIFSAQPFTSKLIASNFAMFKQDLIWKKNTGGNFFNAKKMHMCRHETICVFYRKQCTFNRQFSYGKPYKTKHKKSHNSDIYGKDLEEVISISDGKRNPITILDFNAVLNRGRYHPSQKPVELMEYLIKTYTNEGDVVLDFSMGSGTTGVAAKNTERSFIGIELDENYFNIAEKRISE